MTAAIFTGAVERTSGENRASPSDYGEDGNSDQHQFDPVIHVNITWLIDEPFPETATRTAKTKDQVSA